MNGSLDSCSVLCLVVNLGVDVLLIVGTPFLFSPHRLMPAAPPSKVVLMSIHMQSSSLKVQVPAYRAIDS